MEIHSRLYIIITFRYYNGACSGHNMISLSHRRPAFNLRLYNKDIAAAVNADVAVVGHRGPVPR